MSNTFQRMFLPFPSISMDPVIQGHTSPLIICHSEIFFFSSSLHKENPSLIPLLVKHKRRYSLFNILVLEPWAAKCWRYLIFIIIVVHITHSMERFYEPPHNDEACLLVDSFIGKYPPFFNNLLWKKIYRLKFGSSSALHFPTGSMTSFLWSPVVCNRDSSCYRRCRSYIEKGKGIMGAVLMGNIGLLPGHWQVITMTRVLTVQRFSKRNTIVFSW